MSGVGIERRAALVVEDNELERESLMRLLEARALRGLTHMHRLLGVSPE